MLPWWMQLFIWIFMILAASSIVVRIIDIAGIPFSFGSGTSTIYGMETSDRYTPLALFITAMLLFKGFTAWSMWTEKDWAINAGIIDAAVGILICMVMMFIEPVFDNTGEKNNINLRYELIFLIPYFLQCLKLKNIWANYNNSVTDTYAFDVPKQKAEPVVIPQVEQSKTVEVKVDKDDHSRFMPK